MFVQKRRIYEKMAKLSLHPFVFASKKVGDIDSLYGRKRKMFKLFRSVNGTEFAPGTPRVKLTRVRPRLVYVVQTGPLFT